MSPCTPFVCPVVHAGDDQLQVDVMPDPQEGGQEGQGLVPVQTASPNLGPAQPAEKQEVELARCVGESGGGEDAVVGGGGLDDFLQALHHLFHTIISLNYQNLKEANMSNPGSTGSPLLEVYQASALPLALLASPASPLWASRIGGSQEGSSQLDRGTLSWSCPTPTG